MKNVDLENHLYRESCQHALLYFNNQFHSRFKKLLLAYIHQEETQKNVPLYTKWLKQLFLSDLQERSITLHSPFKT